MMAKAYRYKLSMMHNSVDMIIKVLEILLFNITTFNYESYRC